MMNPRTLGYVIESCAGRLIVGSEKTTFRRVCIDSRQTHVGDLFVAVQGERFDGHQFMSEACGAGAVAVVIGKGRSASLHDDFPRIEVTEPRVALGSLAARYRMDFSIPMVAVAGSNGKTTTKELLASILRQRFETLWSEASFNNDIGVPLTLLRLEDRHQVVVLEVGSNHPGELEPLLRMIAPTYGILTDIGREHLEFFGDLDGVIEEEGCLAGLLPADGCLFINGDVEGLGNIRARCRAPIVTIGSGPDNDWQVVFKGMDIEGTVFELTSPRKKGSESYRVRLLGRHHAQNAALAAVVADHLGMDQEDIARGLEACPVLPMRMQAETIGGVHVLNDAYNANPDSLRASLETLRDLSVEGRRFAVLGGMAELGEAALEAHTEAGKDAVKLGVDNLLCLGKWAKETVAGAQGAGLEKAFVSAGLDGAAHALAGSVRPGDCVLIKASRADGLERLVAHLKKLLMEREKEIR